MTTAPAAPQEQILYGPDGQALTSSTPTRAAAIERPAAKAGDWHATHTTGNATVWEKKPAPAAPKPVQDDRHQQELAARDKRINALEARINSLAQTPATPSPAPAGKERKGFNHWGPWIALWAAVGLTASGEYALAHFVGFHPWVSALLPIGIDIYVIQAFRRHRDVAAALILMVLTNALVHLAEAGLFGVETVRGPGGATTHEPTWWLIVLVSAIAPFIVWRVHRITETVPATAPDHTAETGRETAAGTVAATRAATPADVSPAPRNAVADTRETAPATPPTDTATPPVADAETPHHQRETTPATRRATPRRTPASRPRKASETGVAAPSKLRSKEEQLSIVAPFVDDWNGPEKDLPLQPIADALGASKATASRRVAEYRAKKTA